MTLFVLQSLAQAAGPARQPGVVSLMLQAGPLVQLVLLLLLALSVASWGIIAFKSRQFRRAGQEGAELLRHLRDRRRGFSELRDLAEPLREAPEAVLLKAAFAEMARASASGRADASLVHHALQRASTSEILRLERHLTLLATTGSAAPFIGLFGTVWGILNTFRSLGFTGSTSLSVVAPGIAEALVATAAGLAAAIPAVMAYNHYVRRLRVTEAGMESFASELLDRLQRGEA